MVIAVAMSAVILHAQVSSALVTRGDELQFRGLTQRSMDMYSRALIFDPRNLVAADRYAFGAMMRHDRPALERCEKLTGGALAIAPRDLTIRFDRALCEHRLGHFGDAAKDFAEVGLEREDPRALLFAAIDLHRVHSRRARWMVRRAAAVRPAYRPAIDELVASRAWNT